MKAYERKGQLYFWCPGCNESHAVSIDPTRAREMRDGSHPVWGWNGDTDKPTLSPSINYPGSCHFFIKAGQIEFQGDCNHALAGQTVAMVDWEPDWLRRQ